MQKKEKPKKIILSKETLRQLENGELTGVDGAISGSVCGWDTCWQLCQGTKIC